MMLKKNNFFVLPLFLLFAATACNENKQETSTVTVATEVAVPDTLVAAPTPEPAISEDSAILKLNRQILSILKQQDYAGLANFIHPNRGIRFSPYGYVDTLRNLQFSAERFKKEINSNKALHWGEYDGSGDSILLSSKAYFSKFVYNKDFLNAEKTSLNKVFGKGNSLNNIETVYKGRPYVENYFSGFDKKYGGMDWCSLKLVFEKMGESYYLVGLVHDQWTS